MPGERDDVLQGKTGSRRPTANAIDPQRALRPIRKGLPSPREGEDRMLAA